jgi:hypothetical protein
MVMHVTCVWEENNIKLPNNLVKSFIVKVVQEPQAVKVLTGL